jgi:hypothetical protein
MSNAAKDQNGVSTLLGVLDSDGETLVRVKVNESSNNSLQVDDNTTGSDNGPSIAPRDQNFVPALIAVSSVDGVTPVVVYADSNGKLLIDSN